MNDRTNEFLSVARSLPSASVPLRHSSQLPGTEGVSHPSNAKSNSTDELRQFHKTAADISRDIAATSAMLSELAHLVRQKSLFVDDSQQINTYVMRIKGNVESLNGRLDDAGSVIARHKRQLGKNSQAGQEASNVVGQLKEEFGEAAAGFKKVLQQRTDVMKETTDRKRQVYGGFDGDDDPGDVPVLNLENQPPVYLSSSSMSTRPSGEGELRVASYGNTFPMLNLTGGMSTGESSSSSPQLPRPHGASSVYGGRSDYGGISGGGGMRLRHSSSEPISSYSGTHVSCNHPNNPPLTPFDIQRMEMEMGQEQRMQLIPDQDYLRERADAMSQVESNIVELGSIFNKLAIMVSEHRDLVQRVEDNVDDANSNMSSSLTTLTDTLHSLQTNRALFFKILSVLVVFILVFVIFLA